MTFNKYEFTPTEWETLQKQIQQTTETPSGETTSWVGCAVVEIGFICLQWGEDAEGKQVCVKQSDKWAVDILWDDQPLPSFVPFEVYPSPCGVHTFAGCDAMYLESFCKKFPDSPYCVVPEPTIE